MLKHYELIVIFTPILSDDDLKKTIKHYADFVKQQGGEMVHEETWGLRQLAYPIDKKTTGIYHLYEFKAPGDTIEKMEVQFGRDDRIMRFVFTKLDKYAVEYNERRRQKLAKKAQEKDTEETKAVTEKEEA